MTSTDHPGRSYPLGATLAHGGTNFSLFSRSATGVELLLFDREDDAKPVRVIRIDPASNRTYHYWHVFVPGVLPGQIYGYRVEGPWAPERGLRFNSAKVLLDPYGRGVVVPRSYDRDAARKTDEMTSAAMKSVVIDPGAYDWEGDIPLNRPSSRTIIYEMHVRRFHTPPEFRRRREDARHPCRSHREDTLPSATRHLGRGTAARVPV